MLLLQLLHADQVAAGHPVCKRHMVITTPSDRYWRLGMVVVVVCVCVGGVPGQCQISVRSARLVQNPCSAKVRGQW